MSDFLRFKTPPICFKVYVQSAWLCPGLITRPKREEGGGVPTDPGGELTESKIRKSKILAKRRLEKVLTKSNNMKRQFAELCESDTKSKR